jgi:hypothetical protein
VAIERRREILEHTLHLQILEYSIIFHFISLVQCISSSCSYIYDEITLLLIAIVVATYCCNYLLPVLAIATNDQITQLQYIRINKLDKASIEAIRL